MNFSHSMEHSETQVKSKANTSAEISKVSVAFIAITAGVIGCWATACLFAGTISSGSPVGLIQKFITAVVG